MLTLEEHQTRAMLMGMVYDWRDHSYTPPSERGRPTAEDMLDADSLEPLPLDASNQRIEEWVTRADWDDFNLVGHRNPKLPRKVTIK